jgi:thiol:disulfide interchange protein
MKAGWFRGRRQGPGTGKPGENVQSPFLLERETPVGDLKGALRTGWKRPVFWVVLIGFAVAMNWPTVRGFYQRATGAVADTPISWQKDLPSALAAARATHRPVLVDFGASWCPPCVAMKRDVWPDREVARLVTKSYVALSVDVDRSPELADRYSVSAIPAVLVLDSDGRVLRRSDGYLPRDGVLQLLRPGSN